MRNTADAYVHSTIGKSLRRGAPGPGRRRPSDARRPVPAEPRATRIVQLKSEDEISRNEISKKFREISSAPSAFHEIHCCSTSAGFRMECHFNEISRAPAPSPRHVDQLRSALRLRPVADHCRRHPRDKVVPLAGFGGASSSAAGPSRRRCDGDAARAKTRW